MPWFACDLGCVGQRDRRDAGGDVKSGLARDAERLQGDGIARAADQRVGAEADANRGAGGAAGIAAGQGAGLQVGLRREHGPDDHAGLGVADIGAELGDIAGVMLGDAVGAGQRAIKRARRAENETPAARDVAAQHADGDARGRRRRRNQRRCRAEHGDERRRHP